MAKKQTFESINRVSAASVKKGSGKDWDEWVALLDGQGARHWTHQEIVAFLRKKHRLGPWWQQGVATGYEFAIGRRAEGTTLKGDYSLTCTKTLRQTPKVTWAWLKSAAGAACWLKPLSPMEWRKGSSFETEDGAFGEIRTLEVNRRLRLTWQDPDWAKPTTVEISLHPRAEGKHCLIAISQTKVSTARLKTQLRARWREVLDSLTDHSAM